MSDQPPHIPEATQFPGCPLHPVSAAELTDIVIGRAAVMAGDVVLGLRESVVFIPAHRALEEGMVFFLYQGLPLLPNFLGHVDPGDDRPGQ